MRETRERKVSSPPRQPVAQIVGGKQSRAGVFEDDDDDVTFVTEIQYVPSPEKQLPEKAEKTQVESPEPKKKEEVEEEKHEEKSSEA